MGKNCRLESPFFYPNMCVPPPPQTPEGYEKGNHIQYKIHKMNNIRIRTRYLSVNRTIPFLPFFSQKWAFLPENCPFLA
jgi:hypothetical protein